MSSSWCTLPHRYEDHAETQHLLIVRIYHRGNLHFRISFDWKRRDPETD